MGSSVVETTGKKKLSGTAKGYIILVGLVVLSWAIFKVWRTLLRSAYRFHDGLQRNQG